MNPDIEQRLSSCQSLPSLPTIVLRIVELSNDPDANINACAEIIQSDPALTAEILRLANSAFFAVRADTLRQAILVMGLDGALSLSLSFTLVRTLKQVPMEALDYDHFWRRSFMTALASRALGRQIGRQDGERLFLAGLLQDIGMLALSVSDPGGYRQLASMQHDHEALCKAELNLLGCDHSVAGGWLLRYWELPDYLHSAVANSHAISTDQDDQEFQRTVALSGPIADIFLVPDFSQAYMKTTQRMEAMLDLNPDVLAEAVKVVAQELKLVEELFDVPVIDEALYESVLDRTRELLTTSG